jgi:hypothetical protein
MSNNLAAAKVWLGVVMLFGGIWRIDIEAQNDAALEWIRSKTNVEALRQKAQEWRVRDSLRYVEAVAKAKEKGWPIRTEDSTGVTEIAFLDERGRPVYRTTTNTDAAISTQTDLVHSGGGAGYDLNGENMTIGEWDGGGVLTTHEILTGRVTQRDTPVATNYHATHVAGTLIGSDAGNNGSQGMAPDAMLDAYDWNSDNTEMAAAAADGLLISNHSYGLITGWAFGSWSGNSGWHWWGDVDFSTTEDSDFGRYSRNSWDQIAYDAPFYLIVKSAGNDRGDGPNSGTSHYYWEPGTGWMSSTASREKDGGTDGFDCISFYGISKNILTIGAAGDVLNYNGPGDVSMSSFSGWGPADDGRIKPDVVGNGIGLFSSDNGNNSDYRSLSGTSMSGPNVAGSLLLLQQLHLDLFSNTAMLSATLKGLVIHTARATGDGPAPDYEYGWGLLSTRDAADLISDAAGNDSLLMELNLQNGGSESYTFVSDGTEAIKVTVCWTDPPGTTKSGLNNREPALVNDLDLRIEQDGTTFEPYLLDVENPSTPATTGDDTVNNVEQIYIEDPMPGEYVVTVSHKGTLSSDQDFSMITSGFDLQLLPTEWLTVEGWTDAEGHRIQWTAESRGVESMEVQWWNTSTFETVGQLPARNQKGPQDYEFLHPNPTGSNPFIYRIRSTDSDGSIGYSPLIVLYQAPTTKDLRIYPNPATTQWTIESSTEIKTLRLLNAQGQWVQSWTEWIPQQISATPYVAGQYFFHIEYKNGEEKIYPVQLMP